MNKVIGGQFEDCPIKLDGTRRCLYIKVHGVRYYLTKDNIVSYELRETKNRIFSSSTVTCVLEWSGGKRSIIVIDKASYLFLVNGCEIYESETNEKKIKARHTANMVLAVFFLVVGAVFFFQLVRVHQMDVDNNNRHTSEHFSNTRKMQWTIWDGESPASGDGEVLIYVNDTLSGYNSEQDNDMVFGKLYNQSSNIYRGIDLRFDVMNNDEKIDTCRAVLQFELKPDGIWNFRAACGWQEDYPSGTSFIVSSVEI